MKRAGSATGVAARHASRCGAGVTPHAGGVNVLQRKESLGNIDLRSTGGWSGISSSAPAVAGASFS